MAGKKQTKTSAPRAVDEIALDSDVFALQADDFTLGGDDFTLDNGEPEGRSDLSDVSIEAVAEGEINEVLAGFKDRAKQEAARHEYAVEAEYWFCLYFQTIDQKEEFLRKIGWDELGDKYIDGMAAADAVGIELESFIPPMPQIRIDGKLAALAQNIKTTFGSAVKKKRRIVIMDE